MILDTDVKCIHRKKNVIFTDVNQKKIQNRNSLIWVLMCIRKTIYKVKTNRNEQSK